MSTSQEIIELQTELGVANEQNDPIEACGVLIDLGSSYFESAFDLLTRMDTLSAANNFDAAISSFLSFKEQYKKIDIKSTKNLPAEINPNSSPSTTNAVELSSNSFGVQDLLDYALAQVDMQLQLASAFSPYCRGLTLFMNRNPGLSVEYFEQAEIEFGKLKDNEEYLFIAKFCNAYKYLAEGQEALVRVNFGNAKSSLQRSKVALEKLQEELESLKDKEEHSDFYQTYKLVLPPIYHMAKSSYFTSEAKLQFKNRNFKNAVKYFISVVAESELSTQISFNAGGISLKDIAIADYHRNLGWKYLAEAEAFRESELWDKAVTTYDLVRKEWEEAANSILNSGHAFAQASQETILNSLSDIDIYENMCLKEKELKEKIYTLQTEINDLEEKLFTALKPIGTTVNNYQEAVTTVQQSTQIIQTIESKVRVQIEDLLKMVDSLNLEESLKKKIESGGKEVLKSKEEGPGFFDKVKKFTGDVAEIVKNVGEIASPLSPILKFLSMF